MVVSFLLIQLINYTPGIESFLLVIDWMLEAAKGKPELQDQMQMLVDAKKLVHAQVKLTISDLLMNMVVFGAFYALIAGLGGSYAVLRLKKKARRG